MSGALGATPPESERPGNDEPRAADDARTDDEVRADQLSLGRRLRQPRTIVSLVLPLILLALFARALPGFRIDGIPGLILKANPVLPLGAGHAVVVAAPGRRRPGGRAGGWSPGVPHAQ